MTDPSCEHPKYSDGHCANMVCWNYFSKCPRHSSSGTDSAKCSIQKRKESNE